MELYYTTINHKARTKFEISLIDYCIADAIYHLSNSPKSKNPGWCYASKDYVARVLSIDRATVFRSLKTLLKKKLIEQNSEKQRQLRTTQKWYKNVIMDKQSQNATVHRNSRKMRLKQSQNDTVSLKPNSRKMTHNNYNKDNINNKSGVVDKNVDELLIEMVRWAYKRSPQTPGCSEDSFQRSVKFAIAKHGLKFVKKAFSQETNAIQFLKNIK